MRRIRKHGKTTEKKTDRILAGGRIPDGEIRVCDVEKYYGSDTNITKAVDRVSFCVQKGEFVGILISKKSGINSPIRYPGARSSVVPVPER